MKYYETQKFPKAVGKAGFLSIIAICLLALGGISWFAVAKYNSVKEKSQSENKSLDSSYEEEIVPEFNEEADYNEESDFNEENSIITENSTENVPYEQETTKPEEVTFVSPVNGNVSKGFSLTQLQFSKTYNDMRLHTGIDMLCKKGSDVKSASKGTVSKIGQDAQLGKYIEIKHSDSITIIYYGFDTVSVSEGDTVSTGMLLGKSGEIPSECSDEPHIHIEAFKNDKKVSPIEIFAAN